ncbi:conserved unknown protein [Ectocarpus siliculosus]|uniref:SH3 domain-containing protein n=1 Tax=Ectocarpus siliculosus TaxID=2880 RepID=D8LF98_ECTSI|nr:conserved unknown protein [Ectocarpus siliculosus]|eukprot:CBN78823.1 conserved unknown protein [Ectocarpus siliculosus]
MFKKKSSKEKNTEEEAPTSPKGEATPNYAGLDVGGGADPAGGKGGIIDKFSTGRRRLKENIAQKTGKEAVDNSEFEERSQRVADLKEKVGKVRDAMKRQLDCSRALCLACADLGNACSEVGLRDVGFQNAQFQLDEDMRKQLDAAVAKAVESLENKMAPFAELDKMIMSRNKLKLDYDHYMRKVRDLKEKPGSDAAKLSNNEAKLTAARQRLQEATGKLYKGFGYYDAVGGTLCQPEIEMLKQAQQGFFGSAFSVVKGVPARDPQEVAREIESVGKDGMNAPFTLPASEYGSSGGGGLSNMSGMSGAIKDASTRAGGDDSPDRSPASAYVPSASAPWLTGGSSGGGGMAGASSGTGSFKAPPAGGGGSSWWDKHSATADTQPAAAASGWGAGTKGPPAPPAAGQQQARALFSYTAADNTELSLTEGEVLTVVSQDQSGWWTGEKGGRKGLFPSNYVNLI